MLFDSWYAVLRVAASSALAYLLLIAVLRAAGKRALSKMNIFGLAVTVSFGSILATIALNKNVALADGLAALVTLAGLQWVVARASRRWWPVEAIVRSSPRLLLYRGRLIGEALADQRVTEGEVRQAVRSQGLGSLEDVAAVVLESDGSFSVISGSQAGDESALSDVAKPARSAGGQ